eukprot:gb/GECG01007357.1/.p1 GENE.gb/GECG01007357.1/~~gb/GECG01007357.1/.p1  ORF type:complete len:110 (+),score=7.79 gb/GECG01007357.1/:1-330(+)
MEPFMEVKEPHTASRQEIYLYCPFLFAGALSTIVDISSTIALMSKDVTKAGVSVELNVSFASAAKAGEQIVIEAWVLKMGRKLGFTQVSQFVAFALCCHQLTRHPGRRT